jgi:hypothetical protein
VTERPALGLLTTPEPSPPRLTSLLRRLTHWCVPRYVRADEEVEVAAWFATSPRAMGLERVLASGAPVAVWVAHDETAERVPDAAHVVPVGDDAATLERFGSRGLLWPDGIDAERRQPVTPFVRARWRRRWGLPEQMVWVPAEITPTPTEAVNRTAFAMASAVGVQGRAAVEALAWAAPVVTDAATADSIGATDGQEVLVAAAAQFGPAAAKLAGDQRLAASLGRAGRRLVERRHDIARPAGVLATRLGLRTERLDPARRVSACLDELWTPARDHIRLRAEGHALARIGR